MTGRTHDLAALTALIIAFIYTPEIPVISITSLVLIVFANFIGGLFPDIDQQTSDFWDNFRFGPFVAKFIVPILGGHRHISHSLFGTVFFGGLTYLFLNFVQSILTIKIEIDLIWYGFMIGFISHLIMDMPTKAGIPLLWPLKIDFGFPPFKFMRITSGKFVENWIVFPLLILLTGYLLFTNQAKLLFLIHHL